MSFAGVHDVSMGVFAPYPGSEIYNDLVKKGKINHDEKYWLELSYVDITFSKSYCENISSRSLLYYNWLGYIIFYISNYTFRPMRIYTTLKNLINNKHESKGEKALARFLLDLKTVVFKRTKKTV